MTTFEYKVDRDTLTLGNSSTTVSVLGNATIAGTMAITGATTLTAQVHSYEKVTTTGSSDVVDPAVYASLITSGGAHTVTLADGTYTGQVKKIIITAVAAGTITITPAHFADGTSMVMAEISDSVELIFDGTNWNMAQASGVTLA